MEVLYQTMQRMLERVDTRFVRYLHGQINWNSRLIAVLGARGVGKTTLLLQHILLTGVQDSLYVTADDFYFSSHRLFDLALLFSSQGGKHLYIDEIHKYAGWSTEIKNIYDQIPDLQVVYTGSSILEMERGGADLSRRKSEYHLHGLSFREYVNLSEGLSLPAASLDEVLRGQVTFPRHEFKPLQLFADYMRSGYYPFFRDQDYTMHLQGVLKQMVEVDVPQFAEMSVSSAAKLKKLLYVLAQSVPFKPNYSTLERDLQISRNTLPTYMAYLEKSQLINILREPVSGLKVLQKIEKVYLNNPNIAYALSESEPNKGNLRETIFFAWLRVVYSVTYSPVSDFMVNGLTFEVGGKRKGGKQLAEVKNGYVVKDDIEYAAPGVVPLWMFGFLY